MCEVAHISRDEKAVIAALSIKLGKVMAQIKFNTKFLLHDFGHTTLE